MDLENTYNFLCDKRTILLLAIILAALFIADGFLTAHKVAVGGIGVERNPLLRDAMAFWGPPTALFIIKFLTIFWVFRGVAIYPGGLALPSLLIVLILAYSTVIIFAENLIAFFRL